MLRVLPEHACKQKNHAPFKELHPASQASLAKGEQPSKFE